MKIPWKNILGWGTSIVFISGIALDYKYNQPPTESDMSKAGYEPEITTALTCASADGKILTKESPDNIVVESIDPINITAHYPTFVRDNIDIPTREPTIIGNIGGGCTYLKTYTSSNLNEIRANAPFLVTIFNPESLALERKYTAQDFDRDSGTFKAELRDPNGVLLETLEIIGPTYKSTQVAPAIAIPLAYQ